MIKGTTPRIRVNSFPQTENVIAKNLDSTPNYVLQKLIQSLGSSGKDSDSPGTL